VESIFWHDPDEVPNPAGTHVPDRCCFIRHFGLCRSKEDPIIFDKVVVAVTNLHRSLKEWGFKRDRFPLFVFLAVAGAEAVGERFILCDDVGNGETQVFVKVADSSPVGGPKAYNLATCEQGGKHVAIFCFSQVALRRIMLDSCSFLQVDPCDLHHLHVDVCAMQRAPGLGPLDGDQYKGIVLASGETLRSGPIGLDSVLKARGKTEVGPLPFGLRIGKSLPPLLPEPGPEPVDHLSSDDEKALALDERSSNSSNDEEACDSDGDESPPPLPPPPGPPPPAAPLLDAGPVQVLPGLYDFDRAPSKRSAKCFVCQAQIAVGSYRWLLMPSKPGGVKYHMHKFVHAQCVSDPRFLNAFVQGSLDFC
jgi:hypothetical protein